MERVFSNTAPKGGVPGSGRNYGIDLLRIVSMFYVLVLHTLGKGGALETATGGSHQYMVIWFMETWAYCAVDCFAIISGFTAHGDARGKPFRYSSYLVLWLQVVFYGVLVTVIARIISPELAAFRDLPTVLFPVTNGLYWYFTAYTGLFVCMPLLNKIVQNSEPEYLGKTVIVLGLLFSCFETLTRRFCLQNGYCVAWLVLLYFLGAVIRKCRWNEKVKSTHAVLGILALTLVSWLWLLFGKPFNVFSNEQPTRFLVYYTSPTIVGIAILYVILFSRLSFKPVMQKVIGWFAPCAFAGYLLNCQGVIWTYVIDNRFLYLTQIHSYYIPLHVLGFSAAFLLAAMLIDRVRLRLFAWLRVRYFAEKLEAAARKLLRRMVRET